MSLVSRGSLGLDLSDQAWWDSSSECGTEEMNSDEDTVSESSSESSVSILQSTSRQSVCTACALRVHCVRTAWALRAHCVHIAVKPTPCHLCITLQSNKANRTHIEPPPTRYFDVPVNISFIVVEYHYAVAITVTLVSAIVITYFIIEELSVHSRRTTLIPNRNIRRRSRHKITYPYYIPKAVHGHRYLINMACVPGI